MTNSKPSSAEGFLSVARKALKTAPLDFLEGQFEGYFIRELTGGHLAKYNKRIRELQKSKSELDEFSNLEIMSLLAIYSVCDESGNLVLSEEDKDSLADVLGIESLSKIGMRALELSGVDTEKLKNEVADIVSGETSEEEMEAAKRKIKDDPTKPSSES